MASGRAGAEVPAAEPVETLAAEGADAGAAGSPRVVSLLPGATELLAALGVEPVGVSHECDYPPGVASLPAVNRCRIDPTGSPAEVNDAVAGAVEDGGVYEIDRDRLAALDPDAVVTQAVCDVCAVDQVSVREAVADLGLDATVVTLDVHGLEELYEAVATLGDVVGRPETAARLVAGLRARVEAIAAETGDLETGPRVTVLDWTDPPMVAGHWVPELVGVAGGRYGMAEPGTASRPREWDAVRAEDPEVLVIAPCGFELEQTLANLDVLRDREGWEDLTAVRERRVFAMDGHHHVNRAGPRLVRTAAFLAAIVDECGDEAPPTDVVRRVE
jgi:iron complex transport system substrate-binding protein